MKRAALAVLALIGMYTLPATANDSSFTGVGGSMRPMKGEHSTVRMVRERIAIDVYKDYYDTTVDFVFHNTGRKNIATMGFPESNYGDGYSDGPAAKTQFLKFSTSVDGKPFDAKRTILKEDDPDGFDTYWIKVVPFERGQRRKIRVQYRSRFSGVADVNLARVASYSFTGQNWKGKVDSSELTLTLRAPGTWMVTPYWGNKPFAMHGSGARWSQTWRNWEAQGNFLMGIVPMVPGWLVDSEHSSLVRADAWPFSRTVTIPGTYAAETDPDYAIWASHGVLKNGTTFIAMNHLASRLDTYADEKKEGSGDTVVKTSWDEKTRLAILKAGRYTLTFWAGEKQVAVKDELGRSQDFKYALRAAPYTANGTLYVPLSDVAAVLKATFEVHPSQHSFTLKLSNFLKEN
jgi:hypothetical protein